MENNILLKDGTNEIDIIVFNVGKSIFGINVSKVDSIIETVPMTKMPKSHPSVLGIFNRRGTIISCISLSNYLNIEDTGIEKEKKIIVTNFNQTLTGFEVSGNATIKRISWEQISDVPKVGTLPEDPVLIGIATVDNEIISILDLETIVAKINPTSGVIEPPEVEKLKKAVRIVFAEDNSLVSKVVTEVLTKAGAQSVVHFTNGEAALQHTLTNAENVDFIVTDIEMPKRDGLSFAKEIKSNKTTAHIPILVFSSLINDEKIKKCAELGIEHYLSKPDVSEIIKRINQSV